MGWDQKMIIGLSGYARSGKDTVAEHLVLNHKFAQKSFAEPMKKAMYILNPIVSSDKIGNFRYQNLVDTYGLDKSKEDYPEIRRLLQVFGTEVGRGIFGDNFWVDIVLKNIDSENIVISDVRFKNEADAIRNAGGQVWRINRSGIGPVTNHSSETDLDDYMFRYTIDNNSSIKDLNDLVDQIINSHEI
jgi:hypothetical protein